MSKANNLVAVDFETYYDTEYSLRNMSVRNYLYDTRFNAYLVAIYDGESINYTGHPSGFDWSRLDGMTLCAHNASFDEQVYRRLLELKVIPTPVKDCAWLCTADMTAWLGVKRDLASACRHLLGEEVSKAVREAMKGRSASECLSDPDVIAYGNKDAISCYRLAEKYLDAWPVPEREISRLNREAGYRGLALDVPLVYRGLTVLNPKLSEAESKLPWVAKGEKPLSPNAVKSYAASWGIPVPASFAKDSEDFQNWLEEYGQKYEWAKAMGDYRSLNTLIGRIQSIRDGRDPATNRFPYAVKYMGAATGRFCLPGTAEVLTPTGWRQLQHWKGTPIVQWRSDGSLSMLPASANVFDAPGGGLITSCIHGVEIPMTEEHRIPWFTSKHKLHVNTAVELLGRRIDVPTSGKYEGKSFGITPVEARLLVAAQADGHFFVAKNDSAWVFGFKKERKFVRLCWLLDTLSTQYRTRVAKDRDKYTVVIQASDSPWYLSKTFSLGLLLSSGGGTLEAFMDEIVHWDGTPDCGNSVSYSTVSKHNAQVVATLAHLTNRRATVSLRKRRDRGWSDSYRVHIQAISDMHLARVTKWGKVYGHKHVYCPSTKTGFFLCRYNGVIFITGNSGGGEGGGKVNVHNMPRKAMYGVDVRPMFCAAPGHKLIVSDYNQVEARYLLWRVGNEAALEPIRRGSSVYQAYAEACGFAKAGSDIKNTDDNLYKYCKAACLGAGYGCGGVKFQKVAKLMAGLDLSPEQSMAAVEDFRRRNPQIVRFWREHQDSLAFSARRCDETHQVELKSGRILTYWEPRIVRGEIEVYQTRGEYKTRMYGGKLTENEVQASCRDILCDAWLACARAGLLPVLNVHDELVFEVPEQDAQDAVPEVRRLMTTCSPWADGLPLGVDIHVLDAYAK